MRRRTSTKQCTIQGVTLSAASPLTSCPWTISWNQCASLGTPCAEKKKILPFGSSSTRRVLQIILKFSAGARPSMG